MSVGRGANGIIVPMVDTVEHARLCIAAAKYPPVGNRSVGGSMNAIKFGASPAGYYLHANSETIVILQTESPRGVDNADEIYRLLGGDVIFVGPNDLRAQMRSPDGSDPVPEEFEEILNRVLATG
ncbi:aldolase/citrate lyase family protein [Planctomicrobium sp. SH668]|uniref:aldolase/citrate lyase family protein n=1 Tax=Planctomicrobium sp. SH668 TaxID=3448126 RepID=UPI003F5B31A4